MQLLFVWMVLGFIVSIALDNLWRGAGRQAAVLDADFVEFHGYSNAMMIYAFCGPVMLMDEAHERLCDESRGLFGVIVPAMIGTGWAVVLGLVAQQAFALSVG